MAKTRTPGITVLADSRLFIDKRYLGVRVAMRVGAITQEQAEERLRVEMARIEYERERKANAPHLRRLRRALRRAIAEQAQHRCDQWHVQL
jgi:hypothetical protein